MPQQQGLAAVQYDTDLVEMVNRGMFSYAPSSLASGGRSYGFGFDAPTLIGVLVDVAMIAREVTPAGYLQNVLTYRSRHPVFSYSGIEHHGRDAGGALPTIHDP